MTDRSSDNQTADVGLLGASRDCACDTCAACDASYQATDELPPVVVVSRVPLKITSGIGLKAVVVPDQRLLSQWQRKVLELQVLQQLRRYRPGRA